MTNETSQKSTQPLLTAFIEPTGIHYDYFQDLISGLARDRICPKQLCAIALREYKRPPEQNRQFISNCSLNSVLNALLKCAQWGLYPNEGEDHAYLACYQGKCEAKLGYRGKRELKARIGIRMSAALVYENDIVTCEYGCTKSFKHIVAFPDRGKMVGAYGIATFADGDFDFHLMTKEEMDRNNKNSSKTQGTWDKHPEGMYYKTAINMHYNRLPDSLFDRDKVSTDFAPVIIDQKFESKINNIIEPIKSKPDTADILVAEMEKLNEQL